jgi:hypothetical protein
MECILETYFPVRVHVTDCIKQKHHIIRAPEFTANPSWKAYDILDSQLSWSDNRSRYSSSIAAFRNAARQLANGFRELTPREMTDWFPDFGVCRDLLSHVGILLREASLLPQSWSCDNISILKLRAFWKAILTLAFLHQGVASHLAGQQHVGMIQILSKPRDAMVDWIAGCAGIEKAIVDRLIALHTYERSLKTPDIATAPFLPLGNGRLAASPWMLASSSWERNFCAHVASAYPQLYGPTGRDLAAHLAGEMVDMLKKAGFEAIHSLEFNLGDVNGDIDVLAWSRKESYLMAVELYWKIATGDVMEVLHGEETCRKKMCNQLPKYEYVLSAKAGDIVARAFKLKASPTISGWSCGMVVRGFVGSPRIGNERHFLVPDSLLMKEITQHTSLRDLCHWAKTKPFLPQEGRDFQMYPTEVTSPSGIKATFWE